MTTTIAELLFGELLPELQINHFEQTWYTSFNLKLGDQNSVIEDFKNCRSEIRRFEDIHNVQVGLMFNFEGTGRPLSGGVDIEELVEEDEEWRTQLFVSQKNFTLPTLKIADSSDGVFKRYLLRNIYESDYAYFIATILSDSSYDLFSKGENRSWDQSEMRNAASSNNIGDGDPSFYE